MKRLLGRWRAIRWPFVTRAKYDLAMMENYTLRDAIRNSNADLRHYRDLFAGLRAGDPVMSEQVRRILAGSRN